MHRRLTWIFTSPAALGAVAGVGTTTVVALQMFLQWGEWDVNAALGAGIWGGAGMFALTRSGSRVRNWIREHPWRVALVPAMYAGTFPIIVGGLLTRRPSLGVLLALAGNFVLVTFLATVVALRLRGLSDRGRPPRAGGDG